MMLYDQTISTTTSSIFSCYFISLCLFGLGRPRHDEMIFGAERNKKCLVQYTTTTVGYSTVHYGVFVVWSSREQAGNCGKTTDRPRLPALPACLPTFHPLPSFFAQFWVKYGTMKTPPGSSIDFDSKKQLQNNT